ncbi:MAG: hypothetical protein K6F09_08155 [Clostridiales bacterium]|nr:hypothetical protein [Clostridiales bacterium]
MKKNGKKKIIFITAAVVLLAAAAVILRFTVFNGGGTDDAPVVFGDGEEEEYTFDFSRELAPEKKAGSDKTTCKAVEENGKIKYFEMRFSQRVAIDEELKSAKNMYFASVVYGKKTIAVPAELIKIVTDITTNEYVITFPLPEKYGDITAADLIGCETTFYLAPKDADENRLIFTASAKAD